mmetsp:Transcript_89470/g.178818  ORF Transcript_89470/g.178818 Transcript_89470/m.178818 type:complete len:86 (+) Transcript_89470:472-729(+)
MAQSCTRIRGDSSPTSTSLIHSHKQPQQGVFSAFDTTYLSHVLTDQLGVVCMAAVGTFARRLYLHPLVRHVVQVRQALRPQRSGH